jgi:hypothetical protein
MVEMILSTKCLCTVYVIKDEEMERLMDGDAALRIMSASELLH